MTWRAFVAVLAVAFAATAPALADLNEKPTITGDPVVGSPLSAVVDWEGDQITYTWGRCPNPGGDDDDDKITCEVIPGASGANYTPTTEDIDSRIAVAVEVRDGGDTDDGVSNPTEPVRQAPSPPPAPSPSPSPSPEPSPSASSSPQPSPSATTTPAVREFVATTPPPAVAAAPTVRYLLPFPVVRIKGQLSDGGAVVTLLRVTAPRKSKVRVDCAGASCPVPRLGQGPGRVRAFERFLHAGTRIVIRVRRPELVGKHVRITIRDGKRPARRDSCLLPGSARAAECPQP